MPERGKVVASEGHVRNGIAVPSDDTGSDAVDRLMDEGGAFGGQVEVDAQNPIHPDDGSHADRFGYRPFRQDDRMRNEGGSPCSVPSPTLLIERFGNGSLNHYWIDFKSIGKRPEQPLGMIEAANADLIETPKPLGDVPIAEAAGKIGPGESERFSLGIDEGSDREGLGCL